MAEAYRVLIVDDDAEHVEMMTEYLKISGSFDVTWVDDLHGLWEHLESSQYDIVLLDYRLPDGNGLEALAEINQRHHQVPVIMVTGQGDERVAVQAIRQGAVDYLIKSSDHLLTLPALIQRAIQGYQLQLSVQRSLEQIRYQALLLNNVRDAVVVWDTEGVITYWNPAAEMLFGWRAAERVGEMVEECYFNTFTPPPVKPKRDSTGGQEIERQYSDRNGRMIWVSSRISALRDYGSDGRLIGYMDVARDVSNRKEIEAHLKAAQSRLTQSIRLASVGELAAGFAHHINNPLTTIIAEAQIMLHKMPADHPVQESAQAIERAGWRVQQAVQRLLDFSRPVPQTLESLSINHTIEEALALVGDHIRSKGITLQTQLAENLPEVRGDARQFQDVWVNLLLLARDAAIPDQPLTITVRSIPHTSGQVAIEVQDDGKLIPPEALNKLFEPNFFNPPGGRGTGLEFGICQEIVSQYNGQIVAESTNQHGTIIRVILPVGNPDDDSQHLDR